MAIQSNFPAIRPSLLLDFANSKRLDPRITFTRASTARFYDGSTVAKAEENLVTYSQVVDDAAWTKTNTTATADQTTAPDGTSTADLLAETTANNVHQLSRNANIFITSGLTYTYSVFLKKGTGATAPDVMQLSFASGQFGATQYANFDINAGTVGTTAGGITASIVSVGSGWYRCIITLAATGSSTTSALASVTFTNNNDALGRNPSYAGATTSDVFVWGAQLEQRSAVTAYTATTTAPITNYVPVLQTAASGVPRFDHNPTTGESLGLLREPARTNLLTYSEDFSNAAWINTATTEQINVAVAPDGTLTADRLIEDTTNSSHIISTATITVVNGSTYTFSVYAKAYGRTAIRLSRAGGVVGSAFNLATGTVTDAAGSTGSITNVGNGWYRCAITFATISTSLNAYVELQTSSSTSAETYTGNGWSGVMLWGGQVELGAFATSYIPTVAASATRQADVGVISGSNFSSFYNAAEGTLYGEFTPLSLDAGAGVSINDNTANNRIRLAMTSTSEQGSVVVGGTTVATLDGGTPAVGTTQRVAMAYKVNDFSLSLAGGAVNTDTSGAIPVVSQMQLGATPSTEGAVRIRKFAYYPLRISDSQLQAITG